MQEKWHRRPADAALLQTLKSLPIFQTASTAVTTTSDEPAISPHYVSLLGDCFMAPPGTLDALLAKLPPAFVSAPSEAQRRVLSSRLGVRQLAAVEFYRQALTSACHMSLLQRHSQ